MYIAIEIGSKFSSAAIIDEYEKPVAIDIDDLLETSKLMPTAIYVEKNGNIHIGMLALKLKLIDPIGFKDDFKKDFGENISYKLNGKNLFTHDLYREIMIYLKKRAEECTRKKINKLILTYPLIYNKFKLNLLKKIAILAGFEDVKLIDEPSSAAYYYFVKYNPRIGERLVVFDFGGSNLHIALIEYMKKSFKHLIKPIVKVNCGGSNIDDMISKEIYKTLPIDILEEIKKKINYYEMLTLFIKNSSVEIKHMLSKIENYKIYIPINLFECSNFSLSRASFNKIIEPLIDITIKNVKEIMQSASLDEKDIGKVFMVGGTTKIPYVEDRLKEIFGNKICTDKNYILANCLGAILYSNKDLTGHKIAIEESKKSKFKLGDYIEFGKYRDEPIIWKYLKEDENGFLLVSEYILCFKAFDAAENHMEGICEIEIYGSNKWSNSNIREWLNSNKIEVEYSTTPPNKEAIWRGFNGYEAEQGFLTNFNKDEINKFGLFKHNGLEDKVFLLSEEEIKDLWPNKNDRLKIVSKAAVKYDEYCGVYKAEAGKVNWYWTRTPLPSPSRLYIVFNFCSSSYYSFGAAYYGHVGVVPAIYLKTDICKSGEGTREFPCKVL